MKTEFEKGDFVRLKTPGCFKNNRGKHQNLNIFSIDEIDNLFAKLSNCDTLVPVGELLPVPINGVDDASIYYDSKPMAVYVSPMEQPKSRKTDYTYFMEQFKRSFDTNRKSFYDIVVEKGYVYVHEVQHFLKSVGQKYSLMFDDY